MTKGAIFVTGGAGYIGSHTVLALIENGYRVTIIDNFDNASERGFERVKKLAGENASVLSLIKGDLRNFDDIDKALSTDKFDAVIHFAGRKAVGESVSQPMLYYTHNVVGAVNLIEAMRKHNLKNVVFSSSATVYGNPQYVPLDENHPLSALNPYGRSKLIIEDMFRDLFAAEKDWSIILLRYFNPVGAHASGEIGEDPVGIPNNLMPYVQQVAVGRREALGVFGSDYDTPDGTGVRDYIHVVDLAEGHVAALKYIEGAKEPHCKPINLGTGKGTSVLEMVAAFEKASGKKVQYEIKPRRPGDAAAVWAATDTAEKVLGWKAKRDVSDMCRDQWRWASQYPYGFGDAPEA